MADVTKLELAHTEVLDEQSVTYLYNALSEKQVDTFADVKTGISETNKMLEATGKNILDGGKLDALPEEWRKFIAEIKPTKAEKKSPAKTKGEKPATRGRGWPGRSSTYSGCVIIKNVSENPRRADTHGWHAWNVLTDQDTLGDHDTISREQLDKTLADHVTDLKSKNHVATGGMRYENYIAAKGGNNHLKWDIDKGFVHVLMQDGSIEGLLEPVGKTAAQRKADAEKAKADREQAKKDEAATKAAEAEQDETSGDDSETEAANASETDS